jgi:WD40 repeat protein
MVAEMHLIGPDAGGPFSSGVLNASPRAAWWPQAGKVWGTAFSPDGQLVLTVSEDGTSRIYPWEMFAPREDLQTMARTRTTRVLTREEREKYLHEI